MTWICNEAFACNWLNHCCPFLCISIIFFNHYKIFFFIQTSKSTSWRLGGWYHLCNTTGKLNMLEGEHYLPNMLLKDNRTDQNYDMGKGEKEDHPTQDLAHSQSWMAVASPWFKLKFPTSVHSFHCAAIFLRVHEWTPQLRQSFIVNVQQAKCKSSWQTLHRCPLSNHTSGTPISISKGNHLHCIPKVMAMVVIGIAVI